MEDKSNNKQKTLIHLAISQLGISRADYEMMLSDYWVKSSVDLSFKDAERLINRFIAKGFVIKKKARKKLPPNIVQLVTPQQLAKINRLREDIHWRIKPDGYQRWLKKYLKKDRIATSREANNVIEAMKSMVSRQQKAAEPDVECYRDGCARWQ